MGQLQELEAVLTLEHERAQATPAMRLLDEVGAGYECVCVGARGIQQHGACFTGFMLRE